MVESKTMQSERVFGHALVIVCTACLMYSNTLNGKFVFDDNPAITDNADCDPQRSSLYDVWQNNFWGQKMASPTAQHASYRPITTLTFRANAWFHGMNPWGFHVINVVLHSIASLLFYFVAAMVHGVDTPKVVSLLAALLFAVHPVHSEAVANIVGRSEILSCIFMFAAFLCYGRGCQGKSTNYLWMLLCYAFTSVAVLCKEQGITIAVVCIVYDIMCVAQDDPLKLFLELDSEYQYQELLTKEIKRRRADRMKLSEKQPDTKADAADRPTGPGSNNAMLRQRKSESVKHASQSKAKPDATNSLLRSARKQNNGGKSELHDDDDICDDSPAIAIDPIPRIALYVFFVGCVVQQRLIMNGDETFTVDEKTNPANHIEDFGFRSLTKGFYVTLHGWLLMFPYELCCDWSSYGIGNIESYSDVRVAAVALCFCVVVYLCWLALDFSSFLPLSLRAKLATGIALVVFPFLPASGLLLEVGFVVAERVLYVPSAGWCFLLSLWAWRAWTRSGDTHSTSGTAEEDAVGVWTPRHALVVLVAVLLASYAATLWERNKDWTSEFALYESGVRSLPNNAKLHHNYAHSIPKTKEWWHKIEYHYREAIRIYPPYGSAYINLGVHLAETGRLAEAVDIWKEGIVQWNKRPILGNDPVVLALNAGTGLKNLGRVREAIPHLEHCLQRDPRNTRCRQRLDEARQML